MKEQKGEASKRQDRTNQKGLPKEEKLQKKKEEEEEEA